MNELARTITEEHALSVLLPRALDPGKVASFGVYSVTKPDELPDELRGSRYATVPGLVFPWHSPSAGDVVQYRPDNPALNDKGDPVKYVFPGGQRMVLTKLRDPAPDSPMLLAEGTMQSLAAALYSSQLWAVYGMSGCWSWRNGESQVAIPDLMVAEGRDVVIALDADAATNLNVYNAGMALKDALLAEGSGTVTFLRLPGQGAKAGLDDVLGQRPEEKRSSYLARLLAHPSERPADKAPRAGRSGAKGGLTVVPKPGRPVIAVNDDRHDVINAMTAALRSKWDGEELFAYGRVLTRRKSATLEPVTDGIFADLIAEAAQCVTVNAKGDASFSWPDEPSRRAVLSSRVDNFAPLERVSEAPFVRADGSICQTSGYDAASATYLVLDEAAERVKVPDDPTEEDVHSAVKLLCDEWLGDLFAIMPEDSDRANALAMMLTPLIRGLVPLAPLAVVDGLQMGVGKNLVSDCLAIFATGRPANPLPYSREDEENRKVITASFRQGHELFVFDEAHVIEGRNLARAITGLTYSDRVLGVSNMAEFPNRITWVALGNNVAINGDLSRRVYRIRLAPKMANPQDRDVSGFRHPDLKRWTADNRPELLGAALTLIRAWFAAGQPAEGPSSANGRRFGSFEPWGALLGGVLDHAGVPGFLGNLTEWRSESDYESTYWTDHFGWLRRQFGAEEFAVGDVVERMRRQPMGVDHPPRLEDHDAKGYNRLLGQSYGRMRNRTFSGLQLVRVLATAGHGNRWQIVDNADPAPSTDGDDPATPDPGTSGTSGTSISPNTYGNVVHDETRAYTEKGDVPMYPIPPIPPTDQEADPLAELLPFAVSVPAPVCPDCDQNEEPVPPDGFWFACPRCHPGTFSRA